MASAKQALRESISFESLVESPTLPQFKSLFVDKAIAEFAKSGKNIAEIKVMDPSEVHIAVIDEHASMGYNVFKSKGEYDEWMNKSLYQPTQDQIEEAITRGDGT